MDKQVTKRVAKAMMMDALSCADVAIWLRYEPSLQDKPHKLAALRAHVDCCPTCTQTLKAQIASQVTGAFKELGKDCDACQADLAAFIEIEHDQGIETARSIYPHVWWHLLDCATCFRVYQETAQFIEIDRELQLPPMVFPARPILKPQIETPTIAPRLTFKPQTETLKILRRTLGSVFAVQATFGVARGGIDEAIVLAKRKYGAGELVARAYEHATGAWTLLVEVTPSASGFARIICGETSFSAPLNAEGRAEIPVEPATLITSAVGPDIEVVVEVT